MRLHLSVFATGALATGLEGNSWDESSLCFVSRFLR